MPNSYFRAKYLWEHDSDREAGFEHLRAAIADKLGENPFERPDTLTAGSRIGAFESTVADLLSGTFINSARSFLLVPFGRVWSALWELDRYPGWLDVLLRYDFFRPPEAVGFDEEEYAPPVNEAPDFDAIVSALETAARKGELSPDWKDQPNGGRPVLALDSVDAVDDVRWGPLKTRLQAALAAAFAAAPADPWKYRVEENAPEVAIGFLQDLFGRHGTPPAGAQGRWEAISRTHPAYADAVRKALVRLESIPSPLANDIVKIDARRDVPNGAEWLRALSVALSTGSFSGLG